MWGPPPDALAVWYRSRSERVISVLLVAGVAVRVVPFFGGGLVDVLLSVATWAVFALFILRRGFSTFVALDVDRIVVANVVQRYEINYMDLADVWVTGKGLRVRHPRGFLCGLAVGDPLWSRTTRGRARKDAILQAIHDQAWAYRAQVSAGILPQPDPADTVWRAPRWSSSAASHPATNR